MALSSPEGVRALFLRLGGARPGQHGVVLASECVRVLLTHGESGGESGGEGGSEGGRCGLGVGAWRRRRLAEVAFQGALERTWRRCSGDAKGLASSAPPSLSQAKNLYDDFKCDAIGTCRNCNPKTVRVVVRGPASF